MLRAAFALCAVAGLAVTSASASVIATGSLSSATGGIVTGGAYATQGFVLQWTVVDNGNSTWTYTYDFFRSDGTRVRMPGVSHMTIELSDNFTLDDLVGVGPTVQDVFLDTFSGGPADPGWPGGSMYGAKFETTSDPLSLSITTTRLPMWGSFYVKGGSTSFAYNADFLAVAANRHDYWDVPVDGGGNPLDLVLVPNMIPTPGALALLGVGGLLAGRRRR